ncbi:putative fluoride ion transporter CrcB [Arthrobacter sp. SO5]|uniref:fluoride efflux transporter CrcB n=1 Tax=Arthrobacter sp. SO5 TaxID=1897055 RepID=UPI001E4CAAB3|nr:fluoride efflux transporter CrcB [Arthrobacter sp. SO5]MCB5275845.1 putative fluoride ion transporter CrcB [Arthrobacter sp. SO5]
MTVLLLTLAGAAGAGMRFILDSLVRPRVPTPLPLSTMAINVGGSLLLGLLAGAVLAARVPAEWQTTFGTGFLGGFTTFSTASVETIRLIQSRRSGLAVIYSLGTLVLSLTAAATGIGLGRLL